MPRRLALALLALLVLLLAALLVGRRLKSRSGQRPAGPAVPTVRPTPIVPPTPIPARRVPVWFESKADELLRAEAREIPASLDDIAFVRALASAVLEGPRHPDLLRPFPEGWSLRAAYRLKDGLVVIDLAPPPVPTPAPGTEAPPPARWQAGGHEELAAAQTLLVTLARNVSDIESVVLLVGGEPVETLAGHLDLTHPLKPDVQRTVDAPVLEPPPPSPTPTAAPTAAPATPTSTPAPRRKPRATPERRPETA